MEKEKLEVHTVEVNNEVVFRWKKPTKWDKFWYKIAVYLKIRKKRRMTIYQGAFNATCVKDLYTSGIDEYDKNTPNKSKGIDEMMVKYRFNDSDLPNGLKK